MKDSEEKKRILGGWMGVNDRPLVFSDRRLSVVICTHWSRKDRVNMTVLGPSVMVNEASLSHPSLVVASMQPIAYAV